MEIPPESVLAKYKTQILSTIGKFSFKRNPFLKWTRYKIDVLHSMMEQADFFAYLIEVGFIKQQQLACKKCGAKMDLRRNNGRLDGWYYYCKNKITKDEFEIEFVTCASERAARSYSLFRGSKLALAEVLIITYHWWHDGPMNMLAYEFQFEEHTITNWTNFCWEVAIELVLNNCEKIGGPGVVVEIDESKFGKRKYNKGKQVKGVWVFGGVEPSTGRCFLVPVPDRSANTLKAVIKEWILPGTIIYSDMWSSYRELKNINSYEHYTVNHSKEFVNKETGVHTNTIEGLWRHAKLAIPSFHRKPEHMEGYLAKFMLKRKWKQLEDSFSHFLKSCAEIYAE